MFVQKTSDSTVNFNRKFYRLYLSIFKLFIKNVGCLFFLSESTNPLCAETLCSHRLMCPRIWPCVSHGLSQHTPRVILSSVIQTPGPPHPPPPQCHLTWLSLSYPALTFNSVELPRPSSSLIPPLLCVRVCLRLRQDRGRRVQKSSAQHERSLWRRYWFICIFLNPRLCMLLYYVFF